MSPAECSMCRQPLPVGEPVAYRDVHQIIHLACYRPAAAAGAGRRTTLARGNLRAPVTGKPLRRRSSAA
jgi:hypothetical protein